MMHREIVERRGWLDEGQFMDMVGVTNVIPGPSSTEMAMQIGRLRAGWKGLVTSGLSFILPAALIVLGFARAYVRYGRTPGGEAILYGIKPVVVMIVVHAVIKLAGAVLRQPILWITAVGAVIAYLIGWHELGILALGAVLVFVTRQMATGGFTSPLFLMVAPAGTDDLGRIFGVFLKVGALLFGSGYVLLAFLERDLVDRLGLITQQQLLDAIAVGQFTPGPVFTTATFVGYLIADLPGAAVATIGIFLPSFLLVALVAPLAVRARQLPVAAALLDGVNAASLGLMAAVTLVLSRTAIVDVVTVALGVVGALLIWRTKVNSVWLILGAAAVGLAFR
jgi:chromate transporter